MSDVVLIFIYVLFTGFFSGLLGWGRVPSGPVRLLYVLMVGVVALVANADLWGAAAASVVAACWLWGFRTGKISDAEKDAMIAPTDKNLNNVSRLYLLPCSVSAATAILLSFKADSAIGLFAAVGLPLLSAFPAEVIRRVNYLTPLGKALGWPVTVNGSARSKLLDCRRVIEIGGGAFPGGVAVGVICLLIIKLSGGA